MSNPRSWSNRRGGKRLRAVLGVHPDLPCARPDTRDQLDEALGDFARQGVDIIAIDGGDGTIREVLTALPRCYGSDPPDLAIIASGKVNLIAADVGSAGQGGRALLRLIEAARLGTLGARRVVRPVLDVSWRDDPSRVVRGLFFGAAAFTAGNRIAEESVHRFGIRRAPSVVLTAVAVLGQTLLDGERRRLAAGVPMSVASDGVVVGHERHFLVLATTLRRLLFGLWPFWSAEEGPIHWLDVAAPPRRLPHALLAAVRGRPEPWMAEAGYASGGARSLVVDLDQPFVLDGEIFEPGPTGVRLSADRQIGFVAP